MVEKANDIIKNQIQIFRTNEGGFKQVLILYNLYSRHGSLREELKVKTPHNAVEKWFELDPEIFKENPAFF
jgi:hypothetical protein